MAVKDHEKDIPEADEIRKLLEPMAEEGRKAFMLFMHGFAASEKLKEQSEDEAKETQSTA
ncbi:MAG: hypothetical protein WD469_08275 [Paenibacillaceae bacterium]